VVAPFLILLQPKLIRLLFFFEGNYLINYLASKGPELEPFVLGSLIQLFCRITKFGWLDDDKFREVVKEAMDFLSQVTHYDFIMLLQLSEQAICTSQSYECKELGYGSPYISLCACFSIEYVHQALKLKSC